MLFFLLERAGIAHISMTNEEQPACPVDHKAREAWLRTVTPPASTVQSSSQPLLSSCDAPSTGYRVSTASCPAKFSDSRNPQLSHDRQISSIPRATSLASSPPDVATQRREPTARKGELLENAQCSNPITSECGNWVYPSESQFHAALVRKHGAVKAPPEDTIPAIIPIHNAVNERTWHEILHWERRSQVRSSAAAPNDVTAQTQAQGIHSEDPQLVSFKGDSEKLTPRARFRGWLGYQHPFDRHDWLVRRTDGAEVEYVIDYYAGKRTAAAGDNEGPLSFYLDVRPKLNTVEGARMRFWRLWCRAQTYLAGNVGTSV